VFMGADFERLRKSTMLTLEPVPSQGKPTRQLPLRGIVDALDNIAAGCPEPAEKLRSGGAASAPEGAHTGGFGRCPAVVIARMRANGATEDKIAARCN